MAILVSATNELLEDVTQLPTVLEHVCSIEAKYALESSIIRGNGVGCCLGLLNADCKIAVDAVGGQAAGTIWGQNVVDMFGRLWGPSQRTACWLYNQKLLPQLSNLCFESTYGSGGSMQLGQPLWNWDGSPTSGGWPTLLGRPAIPCEHCDEVGTEGDLILVDLSQYGVSDKMRFDLSMHVRFLYDESAFRFVMRADGSPLWASPITPANSTTTLSPIITLSTRP